MFQAGRIYRNMNAIAVRTLAIAIVLAAVTGCKSAPRLAWWKRDKAPEDKSLVARSAAPSLPSAQAKPQVPHVEGLTPATPPSSANLTAATSHTNPTSSSFSSPSSATVAQAPLANYPSTSLANTTTASPSSGGDTTKNATNVAATGPYDPNGYLPNQPVAASTTTAESIPQAPDRYGNLPTAPFAPTTSGSLTAAAAAPQDPYAMPTGPTSISPTNVDRYGDTSPDPYVGLATSSSASVHSAAPTAMARGSVAVSAPGQYRPGGTSTYSATAATQPIEVATRPTTAPFATEPRAAGTPSSSSVPWAPPASTNNSGTRTY